MKLSTTEGLKFYIGSVPVLRMVLNGEVLYSNQKDRDISNIQDTIS